MSFAATLLRRTRFRYVTFSALGTPVKPARDVPRNALLFSLKPVVRDTLWRFFSIREKKNYRETRNSVIGNNVVLKSRRRAARTTTSPRGFGSAPAMPLRLSKDKGQATAREEENG